MLAVSTCPLKLSPVETYLGHSGLQAITSRNCCEFTYDVTNPYNVTNSSFLLVLSPYLVKCFCNFLCIFFITEKQMFLDIYIKFSKLNSIFKTKFRCERHRRNTFNRIISINCRSSLILQLWRGSTKL